jgi:quercetin 2,3-dioxygenase
MNRRKFIIKSTLAISAMLLPKTSLFSQSKKYNMQKSIIKQTQLKIQPAFAGLDGANMFASEHPIEPVLVFTEYYMNAPVFGPHPHAGVSVMTYLLPDSATGFINRDSLGDHSIIEPGGIHVTQAGSGMLHDEFPEVNNKNAHGFQIWINHSDANRMVTPKAMHANSDEVPEVNTDNYKVRIVHGAFENKVGAMQMVTDVNILHIYLQPNKSISLPAKEMAFAYVLNGVGEITGNKIKQRQLINFTEEGNAITIAATDEMLEIMYATAMPLKEQITYGGPFVMTTPEQMAEIKRRYGSGAMGHLAPYKM